MNRGIDRIAEVDVGAVHLWQLMTEVSLVASAAGYPLDIADMAGFMDLLPQVAPVGVNKLLADVEAGDLAEIGELVRQVQSLARGNNVPVPLLDVIVTAIGVRMSGDQGDLIEEVFTPALVPKLRRMGWFSRHYVPGKNGAGA